MSLWLLAVLAVTSRIPPVEASRPLGASDTTAAVTGTAEVIDGDTIQIGDVRIRLEGIDAPEIGQTCGRAWAGSWACGAAAKQALERMVSGRPVSCVEKGHDAYRRLLASCSADGVNLNARMVRDGFAWAFLKYSRSYVSEEAEARTRRVGVWQGDAEAPWTYRERRWMAEAPAAPSGCAIKGKITKNGQIYHTPWSPWYAVAKVDERRGERWFCTEAEAAEAGWRPAGMRW